LFLDALNPGNIAEKSHMDVYKKRWQNIFLMPPKHSLVVVKA